MAMSPITAPWRTSRDVARGRVGHTVRGRPPEFAGYAGRVSDSIPRSRWDVRVEELCDRDEGGGAAFGAPHRWGGRSSAAYGRVASSREWSVCRSASACPLL